MLSEFLSISPKITALPVIHGSGDFAIEVRRVMLNNEFDCVAVPLPPSFQWNVETAINDLPIITIVAQEESDSFATKTWTGEFDEDIDDDDIHEPRVFSYVPIDPCQPVIAAIRIAMQEHIPRAFVDMETAEFLPLTASLPDPYALKTVPIEQFSAAVLPAIPRLPEGQPRDRVVAMANRLRELEQKSKSVLFVCSITDWPWVREAYHEQTERTEEDDEVNETEIFSTSADTNTFLLGELPFITGLYETARAELDDDENLSIDGIKELLLAARTEYKNELGRRARHITPKMLSTYLKYVRNLSLIERRMTPDLYTLVRSAQQIAGDEFAIRVAEVAKTYPFDDLLPYKSIRMGITYAMLPNHDLATMKSRLPGNPIRWRTCELNPRPLKIDQRRWQMRWDPHRQCSWPPEDIAIEKFRTHVKDTALAMLGADLARSEKFSTSLKDGLDIRETLRNWHTGDLYVKVLPPTRGNLDCVLMFFDSPADPRDYPWRITWMAEHHDESTLALFATDFRDELVGPGIGQASYGGAMFLFPPRPIPDVWRDPRLDFADTLEERLLAAACFHSNERHIAILSEAVPGAGWRRLAKKYGKKLIHIPMRRFSQGLLLQLRILHVLNGQEVRSFAAHFIRKA